MSEIQRVSNEQKSTAATYAEMRLISVIEVEYKGLLVKVALLLKAQNDGVDAAKVRSKMI